MDGAGGVARASWVAFAARVSAAFPRGLVELVIDREVVRVIRTSDRWAAIVKEAHFAMGSWHAQRLYELLRDQEGRGRRSERPWWLWLDEFRRLMGLAPGSYPGFDNLRRRVIEPAVAAINEHGRMTVRVIPHRRGRAIGELEITWRPAAPSQGAGRRADRTANATVGAAGTAQPAAPAPDDGDAHADGALAAMTERLRRLRFTERLDHAARVLRREGADAAAADKVALADDPPRLAAALLRQGCTS